MEHVHDATCERTSIAKIAAALSHHQSPNFEYNPRCIISFMLRPSLLLITYVYPGLGHLE